VDVYLRAIGKRREGFWQQAHLDAARSGQLAFQTLANGRGVTQLLHLHAQIPGHFVEGVRQVLHFVGVTAGAILMSRFPCAIASPRRIIRESANGARDEPITPKSGEPADADEDRRVSKASPDQSPASAVTMPSDISLPLGRWRHHPPDRREWRKGDPRRLAVAGCAFHHAFAAQLHFRCEFRVSRFEFVPMTCSRSPGTQGICLLADDERVAAFAEQCLLVLCDACTW
jgi:hypothetical protein